MKRDLNLLTSPLFLAALSLLVANDFLLKPLFHNALTGKLSDFAGLFAFPFFFAALAPGRTRAAYLLTALGFAFWKSPYAQPLIDAWNAVGLFAVGRVPDSSDLIALVALVPSYLYLSKLLRRQPPNQSGQRWRAWPAGCIAVLSAFAFTATSFRTERHYSGKEFTFADTKEGLIKRFERLPHRIHHGNHWSAQHAPDEYTIEIKTDYCFDSIDGLVELREAGPDFTRLVLRKLEHQCPEKGNDETDMLLTFMHEVVERLQDDIDASPRKRASPKTQLRHR